MLKCSENPILVRILCLTYNHEKYIRQALNGFISQQTSYSFEVVIHDDASTDGTVTIIKEYEKKYPHIIKAIYEKKNLYSQGIDFMRLCLEKFCQGKYIAFCEGDDYWIDTHKLDNQISFMEKHPECTLTYHPVNYISNDDIIGNDMNWNEQREVSADEIIHGGGTFCASPSLVFKRIVGVEYPRFRIMADIGDFPLQILSALRGKVYYLPEIMGCYRKNHTGSWTTKLSQDKEKAIKHWNTEIAWLEELDKETNGEYHDSIAYRIARCNIELYGLKFLRRTDVERVISLIKSKRDQIELKLRLWLIDLMYRLPFLATIYKEIKGRFVFSFRYRNLN